MLVPLFVWVNVLIEKDTEFKNFTTRYKEIKMEPITKNIPVIGMSNKSRQISYFEYSSIIDNTINDLVFDICRSLQKTNIFKAKREDAREAIMQL